jgi:hypothetical protein
MPMMLLSTATPRNKPDVFGRRSLVGSGHSASSCTREDEDRVLQRRDAPGDAEHVSFDFLGYTFRGRTVLGKRGLFIGFNPAMSTKATKAVSQKIRAWHLNRRSDTDLSDLARRSTPRSEAGSAITGVLPLQAVSHRTAHRPASGPMGHAEIQATAWQDHAGLGMA